LLCGLWLSHNVMNAGERKVSELEKKGRLDSIKKHTSSSIEEDEGEVR